MSRRVPFVRPAAALLGLCMLGGCASDAPVQPPRARGPAVPVLAASAPGWETGCGDGAELARRDDALGTYAAATAYDRSAWREAPRPTLERARQLWFSQSENQYLYYLPQRQRHRY